MIVTLRSTLVAAAALLVLLSSTWPLAPVHAHTLAHTQDEHRTGTLQVVWGDPLPGTDGAPMTRYTLIDAQGTATALVLDDATLVAQGEVLARHGQQVAVTGAWMGNGTLQVATLASAPPPARTAPADAALATAATTPAHVRGAQRWVTVLCRFADRATFTPHPPSYYHALMGSAYPGMDHYWREVSYNTISIDGGTVAGWYTLPRMQAQYRTPDGYDNLSLLANDCVAAAKRDVAFAQFVGINFIFNASFYGAGGYGSPNEFLSTGTYRTTWLADAEYPLGQGILAHEMGHAFGLPHSSGPYADTYDSQWDVMSGQSTCTPFNDQYGCIAAHTIAHHKYLLDWIPAENRAMITAPGTYTFTVGQLATSARSPDNLVVHIPIPGAGAQFYTVETRRATGYDVGIPSNAVIIHHVNTPIGERQAQLVDGDTNGTLYDDGPVWLPGETFRDTANGITVTVDRATATGFVVTVTSTSTAPVCADIAYEPDNDTVDARPFPLGTTETHAFCDAYDSDWVVFEATAGTTYRIETRNLTPGTDTVLWVNGGGQYRTDDDGNGGLASVITFTAPAAGRYDVGVQDIDGRGGTALRYDVRITAIPAPTTLQPQVWIPLARR